MRTPTRSFLFMGMFFLMNSYFVLTSYSSEDDESKFTLELSAKESALAKKTDITLVDHTIEDYEIELTSLSTEAYRQFEVKTVIATGYTAGAESTGKSPGHPNYGITFSGLEVQRDELSTIAADPKFLPLGTVLYIPNYGYGIVADTGSAIKGNKIDLYYETVDEVFSQWGKKEIDVFVIEEGEGQLTEEEFNQWADKIEAGDLPTFQESL
ncbi:3D domain-containing protein [Allobacillus halotolerans]|uniref:3D domain-containing protein n=2 Tax=Allobacillus TaxID=1400133 RepID=A0ABS6GNZ9_9BACI|nr:3D domain-containing protein [Allobacillus halotolerans]MBU6080379.1 3D domain-containing protein [Allobacillus halotolerans]